jgi:hypothetical protein
MSAALRKVLTREGWSPLLGRKESPSGKEGWKESTMGRKRGSKESSHGKEGRSPLKRRTE